MPGAPAAGNVSGLSSRSHTRGYAVVLLLVFLMLALGLFALFLGGGLVAQGYLYQDPADRFPIRAAVAGLLVAGYLTLWVALDQKKPGRYDTFFNFMPYTTAEFDEFDAIRWSGSGGALKLNENGAPVETVVTFRRPAGGKAAQFAAVGTNEKFEPRGTSPGGGQYMTGALRVKLPTDPEPVRFNALVVESAAAKTKTYTKDRKFVEENGARYVEAVQPGTVYVPSTGAVLTALLINFGLLVVWAVALWPVLKFTFTHALLFAGAATVVCLLALMPVLFKQGRAAVAPPVEAQAVAPQ